jgi:hypothetical protein
VLFGGISAGALKNVQMFHGLLFGSKNPSRLRSRKLVHRVEVAPRERTPSAADIGAAGAVGRKPRNGPSWVRSFGQPIASGAGR